MPPLCLFFSLSLLLQGVQGQSTGTQYVVTSLAGNPAFPNGVPFADGVGSSAIFNGPSGIVATTSSGSSGSVTSLYVCDLRNNRIRNVNSLGGVSVFAGNSASGSTNDPSNPTLSTFTGVSGIATLPSSGPTAGPPTFFVTESAGNRVRRLGPSGTGGTSSGVATTLVAGSSTGISGSTNGPGASATFSSPQGIAVVAGLTAASTLYIVDTGNNLIRSIAYDGNANSVTTVAGSKSGFADGAGTIASFNRPFGITYYSTGSSLYISDAGNNRIRLLSTRTFTVTTIAGSTNSPGGSIPRDGIGTNAIFNNPMGIFAFVPSSGTQASSIFVTEQNTIRTLTIPSSGDPTVSTIAGSPTASTTKDGTGTNSGFNTPQGITVDSSGVVYVVDSGTAPAAGAGAGGVVRKLVASAAGATPSTTPTPTPTKGVSSPTRSPTASPTFTPTPSNGRGASPSETPLTSPSSTPTPTPALGASPSQTPVVSPSSTPTPTTALGSSPSQTPVTSPTSTPTSTATPTGTGTGNGETPSPTSSPTPSFTEGLTPSSTPLPTPSPSPTPTVAGDSMTPTVTPTPTTTVSASPTTPGGGGGGGSTLSPTPTPSGTASGTPSITPSPTSTLSSGSSPSATPSITPSASPSTGYTPPNNNPSSSTTPPLSPGSTAGIVIGSLVGVAAIGAGAAFLMRGSKSKGKVPVTSSSGAPAQSIEVINNPLGGNGSNSATPSTSAPPAPTEAPLPEGWSQMSDETGDVWYVGPAGESVWTRPT